MKNKVGNFFIRMIKGAAIGIAMIIPGLSAGTVSILTKIHQGIIDSVTNLHKQFKSSFLYLLPILLGAVIGFLGLAKPIKYGLSNIPVITVTLFVGLVIGGIPSMISEVKDKFSRKNLIICIIGVAVVIGISFLSGMFEVSITDLNIGTWFYLMLGGFFAGSALVVSGISGSMSLMVLGIYSSLISIISDAESALVGHQSNGFWNDVLYLIPVAIGVLLSFIIMSFVMKFFLKKFNAETNYAVIGLTIGSIFAMYYLTFVKIIPDSTSSIHTDISYHLQWWMIVLSILVLIIGFIATFFMERLSSKKEVSVFTSTQASNVENSINNQDISKNKEEN